MKSFKDFGIAPVTQGLTGDKIKIERILNREIVITDYRIVPSHYPEKGNGKRLDMQITIDNTTRVVWTGAQTLQQMIEQVPKHEFPFKTTIVRQNERFEFS